MKDGKIPACGCSLAEQSAKVGQADAYIHHLLHYRLEGEDLDAISGLAVAVELDGMDQR